MSTNTVVYWGTGRRKTAVARVRAAAKAAKGRILLTGRTDNFLNGRPDLDDAIRRANDSRYGLQASIFTNDLRTAMRAAHALDFGGVLVNEMPTFRTDQMPYGGVRDSGNTKEGPHWSVREMTEERMVVIQL